MRILITGAAGRVGHIVAAGLQERHQIRGFDRDPMPDLEDTIIGSVADMDALLLATKGMDAVIHLGSFGGERAWELMLETNYDGTYKVFEAARQNKVPRVVFASRAGLLSAYPKDQTRTMDLHPRPGSTYDISKIFGESMGYMFAHRYDMEVVCVRIGNFNADRDQPAHPHHLSHGDAVHVFEQAVTHPNVKFEIVFGVSASDWPMYDMDHGRNAIAYYPKDIAIVPEDERK